MRRRRVSPERATRASVAARDAADAALAADAARSATLRQLSREGDSGLPSMDRVLSALAAYRSGQRQVEEHLATIAAALRVGGIPRHSVAAAAGIAVATLDARIAASPAATALLHGGE
ncbi:MAG: hypothetical protein H6523_12890 [Mycolicibacterium sp.]|nr:hypothetical protein [Mycolicibacterium sp.]